MSTASLIRRRIALRGLVQGVGLRPFVCRLAREHGVTGWVRNDAAGAVIEVQGPLPRVASFQIELSRGPPTARIESIQIDEIPREDEQEFAIRPSALDAPGAACPPTDRAPCPACLAEFRTPGNRRHAYPFINCTDCGPRYTLLKSMPFDRERTSMAAFPLCAPCRREYEDAADRRFHAQAIACPDCGPRMTWTDQASERLHGNGAIARARQVLDAGGVIAMKGVGGFHLICQGTNEHAVARLRIIKRRPARPLALMALCLDSIRRCAEVGEVEAEWLAHPARPIVLLRARHATAGHVLANAIAPGVNTLGFMLPYSPVHELLVGDQPLVMTSGNLTGEPLICESAEAEQLLGPLVDGLLDHDREIQIRCDDSVLQVVHTEPRLVRRSRGFVPEPLLLTAGGPCVLAVGGEFKIAPALALGDRVFPGPHVGDLNGWPGLHALDEAASHLCRILHATPDAVACDAHPGYLTHRWAREFARNHGIPCLPIHHHEAHAAAWQVDTGREADHALAAIFDGTGAGRDGTLWGGEFFLLPGQAPAQRRAACLPVPMPGGELAVRKPARMALAYLHAAGVEWDERLPCSRAVSASEQRTVRMQIERSINAPRTSSVGRLFDAVSSLLGICQEATYEGQPAIELEAAAAPAGIPLPDFALEQGTVLITVSPVPVLQGIVRALAEGEAAAGLAYAFHVAVARMITAVLVELRQATSVSLTGFSGGVFQNRLLEELLVPRLAAEQFEFRFHSRLPCNDGGLVVGQAVLARRAIADPA